MEPYSERPGFEQNTPIQNQEDELSYFYRHAYHDMRFFLKAITQTDSNSCVYFGDMQKNLFYVSDNMKEVFGFESHIVENFFEEWKKRLNGERWKQLFDLYLRDLIENKGRIIDIRQQALDRHGNILWIRFYAAVQWDKDAAKPLFFASRITLQDDEFAVDPISNFPTVETLHRHLLQGEKEGWNFTAIGLCLNGIPQINAMYGRSIGDQLIGKISRHLMEHLSSDLSFYRLPGVRCMGQVSVSCKEDLGALIAAMRRIIAYEYKHMGLDIATPCSFAVLHFPISGVSTENFAEYMVALLKMARNAPATNYIEDSAQNLDRVTELRSMEAGVSQDVLADMRNFRAVIQPVVSTETGKIIGGETLMRWQYEGKDISPAVFIPILESDEKIFIAGRWILEEAVKACKRIIKTLPDFYLTVNVSLRQLHDPELLSFIPAVLKKHGLDGRHLVIEATESCLDKEPALINDFMKICHEHGIRIALDDFGTGYSSLRVLLKYPTDIIKLDRSLLLEMCESVKKSNFITSIVFACHQFGKKVCMEGVETEMQRSLVQNANCDMIQGFYYYRPTELSKLYELVEQ